MIRILPDTLMELRNRLRDRGAPASVARPSAQVLQDPQSAFLLEEYGPLAEVMYLVCAADGHVAQAERDVIRGALRELDDRLRSAHFLAMIERAEKLAGEEGVSSRLAAVARAMRDDPVRGEVAFVLACAVAFADDAVTSDENSLLNDFADALGIDEAKSEELMRMLVRQ
jgi:tellurite resistance protein